MIPPGLFITGTGTGVGKTYVTSLIARELVSDGVTVGAYKPVCSGCEEGPNGELIWRDLEELSNAIGGGFDPERVCPQRFAAGLAPSVAARLEDPQSIIGTYGRAEITISDDMLFRGENEFYPLAGGSYYIPASGTTMQFRRDSDGKVDALISTNAGGRETVLPKSATP